MNHKIRNEIIKYTISFSIMTGLLFIVISTRKIFSGELDTKQIYRVLTDGFTIPGILFMLVGLLVFLTNQGSLTGLAYGLKRFVKALIPFMNRKTPETYQEYLDSRKKITGYGFLAISGLIFFSVGIIFLILFYA